MKNIVIFASGSGTNAENIIRYFNEKKTASIKCVMTNNPTAGVIERAKNLKVPVVIFDREAIKNPAKLLADLNTLETDFIVLAGFLWKIPEELIHAFPNKIINIHPALLPKYGGKGMYGMHVHEAVIENKEPKSGITIHYINEKYDEGAIIFQAETEVRKSDTPESLAERIHKLEYEYFPQVVEKILLDI
ncbi:MAG: phosphoribosylglycinamide formyltransferase [Bacteroidales bacterium]|nr:phosphoribosylglycinamide formyltransferase [Bacteroidales bacterium]